MVRGTQYKLIHFVYGSRLIFPLPVTNALNSLKTGLLMPIVASHHMPHQITVWCYVGHASTSMH